MDNVDQASTLFRGVIGPPDSSGYNGERFVGVLAKKFDLTTMGG